MVNIVKLSTRETEVDRNVEETIDKIKNYHEERGCKGLAAVMIFKNGDSVTFSSSTINRKDMLASMLDMLLDYQRNV